MMVARRYDGSSKRLGVGGKSDLIGERNRSGTVQMLQVPYKWEGLK